MLEAAFKARSEERERLNDAESVKSTCFEEEIRIDRLPFKKE